MLDLNLRVAFCREICLMLGLCDVDRPTLLARLRQRPGSAVFLAVGGAAESLLTQVIGRRGAACALVRLAPVCHRSCPGMLAFHP